MRFQSWNLNKGALYSGGEVKVITEGGTLEKDKTKTGSTKYKQICLLHVVTLN